MEYLTRPGKPNDMEIQVKKSVENNKNPGTFKKLVKEDEDNYQKNLKTNNLITVMVVTVSYRHPPILFNRFNRIDTIYGNKKLY